ncbi:MAG: hypothetical protein ACE5NP_03465 [Anaerolineae bacterium]
MNLLYNVGGFLVKAGYILSRLRFMAIPVPLLLPTATFIVLSLFLAGSRSGLMIVLLVGGLIGLALLLLSRLAKYIIFHPQELSSPSLLSPSSIEEKISMKATGYFEVEGKRRYFADLPALFTTTGLGDHIIVVRVIRRRFPLVSYNQEEEEGLWYIFLDRGSWQQVQTGQSYFGFRGRPGIRFVHTGSKGKRETVYLSFATSAEQKKVVARLSQTATRDGHRTLASEPRNC